MIIDAMTLSGWVITFIGYQLHIKRYVTRVYKAANICWWKPTIQQQFI